jgi:hypothetical protein
VTLSGIEPATFRFVALDTVACLYVDYTSVIMTGIARTDAECRSRHCVFVSSLDTVFHFQCQLLQVIWKAEIPSFLTTRVTLNSDVRFLSSNEIFLSFRHSSTFPYTTTVPQISRHFNMILTQIKLSSLMFCVYFT